MTPQLERHIASKPAITHKAGEKHEVLVKADGTQTKEKLRRTRGPSEGFAESKGKKSEVAADPDGRPPKK